MEFRLGLNLTPARLFPDSSPRGPGDFAHTLAGLPASVNYSKPLGRGGPVPYPNFIGPAYLFPNRQTPGFDYYTAGLFNIASGRNPGPTTNAPTYAFGGTPTVKTGLRLGLPGSDILFPASVTWALSKVTPAGDGSGLARSQTKRRGAYVVESFVNETKRRGAYSINLDAEVSRRGAYDLFTIHKTARRGSYAIVERRDTTRRGAYNVNDLSTQPRFPQRRGGYSIFGPKNTQRRGAYEVESFVNNIKRRGAYGVVAPKNTTRRGAYGISVTIVTKRRGAYVSFVPRNTRRVGAYDIPPQPPVTVRAHKRGRARITRPDREGFAIYIGVDGPPDFAAPPAGFGNSLPVTIAAVPLPAAGTKHTLHIVTRKVTRYGLESLNQYPVLIDIDENGDELRAEVTPPTDCSAVTTTDDRFVVFAEYPGFIDDPDPADKWLVYASQGTPPTPGVDTPNKTIAIATQNLRAVVGPFPTGGTTYHFAVTLLRDVDGEETVATTASITLPDDPPRPVSFLSAFS